MPHHRCTGCKQESYPRHKHLGGVYCEACIRRIRGFIPGKRGWLGSLKALSKKGERVQND